MIFKRIRDLREDKDITQTALASAINVTQRTYSYYENGQRDIPPQILISLARFHHTSIDYLLGQTDNPIPYNNE